MNLPSAASTEAQVGRRAQPCSLLRPDLTTLRQAAPSSPLLTYSTALFCSVLRQQPERWAEQLSQARPQRLFEVTGRGNSSVITVVRLVALVIDYRVAGGGEEGVEEEEEEEEFLNYSNHSTARSLQHCDYSKYRAAAHSNYSTQHCQNHRSASNNSRAHHNTGQ